MYRTLVTLRQGNYVRLIVAIVLALSALVLVACGSAAEPEQQVTTGTQATEVPQTAANQEQPAATDAAPVSMVAPTFELPNAKGETVSLASYTGDKNVVLVFYRGFW